MKENKEALSMRSFRLALGFLTVFPIRAPESKPGDLSRAAVWFPAVGLILGSILFCFYGITRGLFPAPLAAALTVAAWAALTGGIHLDGLADCGDGLLAAAAPERRLEIMRDPRLGAFGSISLILFLLVKIFTLASISAPLEVSGALLIAPIVARWWVLWVARQPAARREGMGAEFASGLSPRVVIISLWLPIASIAAGGLRALAAFLCAALVVAGVILIARRRLGGVTGDVLGFTIELVEWTVLLVYAAAPPGFQEAL